MMHKADIFEGGVYLGNDLQHWLVVSVDKKIVRIRLEDDKAAPVMEFPLGHFAKRMHARCWWSIG